MRTDCPTAAIQMSVISFATEHRSGDATWFSTEVDIALSDNVTNYIESQKKVGRLH